MLPFGHQRRTCGQDYVCRYRCGYTHAKSPPTHVKFHTIKTSAVMIMFLLLKIYYVLYKMLTLIVHTEMIKTSSEYNSNANVTQ